MPKHGGSVSIYVVSATRELKGTPARAVAARAAGATGSKRG